MPVRDKDLVHMATLITLLFGWFAFEAVRAACFSRDEQRELAGQGRQTGSLPPISVRTMARARSA
jgi:hypothetical protein